MLNRLALTDTVGGSDNQGSNVALMLKASVHTAPSALGCSMSGPALDNSSCSVSLSSMPHNAILTALALQPHPLLPSTVVFKLGSEPSAPWSLPTPSMETPPQAECSR